MTVRGRIAEHNSGTVMPTARTRVVVYGGQCLINFEEGNSGHRHRRHSGLGAAGRVAVDGTSVYVIDAAQPTDFSDGAFVDGRVIKVPLAGGTPVTLAIAPASDGIAVDGTSVYWTDPMTDTVKRAPK